MDIFKFYLSRMKIMYIRRTRDAFFSHIYAFYRIYDTNVRCVNIKT